MSKKTPLSLKEEKEPKPKFLGQDIFGWGGGLPREEVGANKFGMSFESQGNETFWRDIPGFCQDIPGAPGKFEKIIRESANRIVEDMLWSRDFLRL